MCGVQGAGYRVQGSGFRVQGAEFRVQGTGCRVQGSELRVQGARCRVQGLDLVEVGDLDRKLLERVEGHRKPRHRRAVPQLRRKSLISNGCTFSGTER